MGIEFFLLFFKAAQLLRAEEERPQTRANNNFSTCDWQIIKSYAFNSEHKGEI